MDTPSILIQMKLEVRLALKASGVSKSELARRMGVHGTEVYRVLDYSQGTKARTLELAMAALGKRFIVSVEDANPSD